MVIDNPPASVSSEGDAAKTVTKNRRGGAGALTRLFLRAAVGLRTGVRRIVGSRGQNYAWVAADRTRTIGRTGFAGMGTPVQFDEIGGFHLRDDHLAATWQLLE